MRNLMLKTSIVLHAALIRALPLALAFACLLIAFVPMLAFAQDAGTGAMDAPVIPPVDLGALATDPLNPEVLARFVLDAVVSKNWGLLAAVLGAAAIAALRKYVPSTTVVGKWLSSKLGGIIANFLLQLSLAFGTLFIAGGQISLSLVVKALTIAVTASGSWSIYKNIKEALDDAKAQSAGAAAAAAPSDTLSK